MRECAGIAWKDTLGKSRATHASCHLRVRRLGASSEPSGLPNSSVSSSGLPSPSARRSSRSLRRWSRNTVTALGGKEIVRRAWTVLGALNLKPVLVSRASAQHAGCGFKIGIYKTKGKQLASAKACRQVKGYDRVKGMVLQACAAPRKSAASLRISISALSTFGGDSDSRYVARQQLHLNGAFERTMQDAVRMSYRPGGQRASLPAARLEKHDVPIRHLGRP